MADSKYTVWHAFYDILREYGVDRVFGNPGSTEQPMLKDWPSDIQYIFGLQEASVVAMADGYAQATRKPAVVSLHTAAGTGNAMASIMTAFLDKTPMVIIAGQQTRKMIIGEPFLTNRQAIEMPKPWVKWSYEPVRAEDVPATIVRGFITAMTAPAGPVYLSIPLDDWDVECPRPTIRSITQIYGPDPSAIQSLASGLQSAKHPALVLGPEVDISLAWEEAISLAEGFKIPVYQSPSSNRAVFPELHPLFKGPLPPARGPLSSVLKSHDFLLVVGAEIWRYYPWVEGDIVHPGTTVVQITNDPHDATAALVGSAILSDVKLALDALIQALNIPKVTLAKYDLPKNFDIAETDPLTPYAAFGAIAELRTEDAILIQETPSNAGDLLKVWPAIQPERYITFASGGLGWNAPAAVGLALAHHPKPVVCVIGDGSFNYSPQAVYSAVQHKLKLIYVVPRNEEYAVLKEFAVLEDTPNVPALDLIGLNAVGVAQAYGCFAIHVKTKARLQEEFQAALARDGPSLIEVQIDEGLKPLMGIEKKTHWF